jgi:SAM-dependent methyltransferase
MTEELKDVLEAISRIERRYRRHKLNKTIFEHDDMLDHRNPNTITHYFQTGREALHLVLRAMVLCETTNVSKFLDMPCGFGRELRHFVGAFPGTDFYACELYENKIEFCAKQFGATPVLSNEDLTSLTFDQHFDVVWAGSLLTHFPEQLFLDALDLYSRVLAPGGIALITLQGRNTPHFQMHDYKYLPDDRMADAIAALEQTGFGHAPYTEIDNYGITMSLPSFVLAHLERDPTISLRGFVERGWGDHQDVLIFQKEAIDHRWLSIGRVEPIDAISWM